MPTHYHLGASLALQMLLRDGDFQTCDTNTAIFSDKETDKQILCMTLYVCVILLCRPLSYNPCCKASPPKCTMLVDLSISNRVNTAPNKQTNKGGLPYMERTSHRRPAVGNT